jgi:hypothetical protein
MKNCEDIIVRKLTSESLLRRANEFTSGHESTMSLELAYRLAHSPIRTQLFWIEMHGIPTFASVHNVRHKTWMEHWVKTNREDLGGDGKADRWTPVNHAILCNAESLINWSRKRLCFRAHEETRKIMEDIRKCLLLGVDPALAARLVPECVYRGGYCYEGRGTCGRVTQMWEKYNGDEYVAKAHKRKRGTNE